jgi:regulator of replication initiation timing
MNTKKQIKHLKEENLKLQLENMKLRIQIQELNNDWIHPNSCLHNDDPWHYLK